MDITEDELSEYFSKCGAIRLDPHTGEKKLKIYESDGKRKGDALIQYMKEESVELALEHLNDSDIRPDFKIRVEKATFQQKGSEYQARKKKKTDSLEIYRIKTEMERKFNWIEEGEEERGLKIVILKGMFTPEDIEKSGDKTQFVKDLEDEIWAECADKLGEVEKLVTYDVIRA